MGRRLFGSRRDFYESVGETSRDDAAAEVASTPRRSRVDAAAVASPPRPSRRRDFSPQAVVGWDAKDTICVGLANALLDLRTRNGTHIARQEAALALAELTVNSDHCASLVATGGISALIGLTRRGNDYAKVRAAHVLARAAEAENLCYVMWKHGVGERFTVVGAVMLAKI